jgi:hypothetical protein
VDEPADRSHLRHPVRDHAGQGQDHVKDKIIHKWERSVTMSEAGDVAFKLLEKLNEERA